MDQVATKMLRLTENQLEIKKNFIDNYINSVNAATGSTFDPNSNVTSKNVGTLMSELNKDINIQIKRKLIYDELTELFGIDLADKYIEQIEKHEIYVHDETSAVLPYCVAISMYPFFENGLQTFGGNSLAPRHLSSYCGSYINLIFALSSQFAGAVATIEFLVGFDHFARLDYGENYLEIHREVIQQELQQVVYAINQPASSRGFQSSFVNWSIFDSYYFHTLFDNYTFPDGSKTNWDSVDKLQKFFMQWFNVERTKALLTFPIVTVTLLHDNVDILDTDYKQFVAKELSEGNSFFIYLSDTVDSLSSCCRLRNDISDQIKPHSNDFQYSLGAGGIMTGSINVITLNINRFVQDKYEEYEEYWNMDFNTYILHKLKEQIELIHKYQVGFRSLFSKLIAKGMLPAYTAGFIDIDKQYCTIGINGILESAEFLKYAENPTLYKTYVTSIFKTISEENKIGRKRFGIKYNTELVPAESLGVKFAKWDKKDGYVVPRDCYNSYLYPVENDDISIVDKFDLHGKEVMQYLDGGSALHINLQSYLSYKQFLWLLDLAVETGTPYFCTNVLITICNDCGNIDKNTLRRCPKCGSNNLDYGTRVIGYLKRISNFSIERQQEAKKRYYE